MNKLLLECFKKIEKHYSQLVVLELKKENFFQGIIRAAFAKNFEFNILCHGLKKIEDAFFLTPSLRGICEDLIAIKFINEHIKLDRDELMQAMTAKVSFEGIKVQREFLEENKPSQTFLKLNDEETAIETCTKTIKDILLKNGLNADKDFPSVAQMATDAKLIKLYNFLYYATSKTVHFEPGLLMKLGWSRSLKSSTYKFSTKNFHRYYHNFNSYYATFLFLKFYDAFKKELGLKELMKQEVNEMREILDNQFRMPEIVTFEEMNIKPPSTIIQILNHAAYKRMR